MLAIIFVAIYQIPGENHSFLQKYEYNSLEEKVADQKSVITNGDKLRTHFVPTPK